MRFLISPEIFELFPGVHIGLVQAFGLDNRGENGEVAQTLKEKEQDIRLRYKSETLSQLPRIAAWRQAYSLFGAKPKKYKSSVENLYKNILKGKTLRHINLLVDIYNFISLKHMIPSGGDDTEKVEGCIHLTIAEGGEIFQPLNATETQTVEKGEVVYRDDRDILCRRWNWREAEKTKLTEKTREALLVVEGLPPAGYNDVVAASEDLSRMIQKYCRGKTRTAVLNISRTYYE
ncbi:MAG: hypothetical protein JXB26_10585 [Candidatus Aminicenantes bacterium]|nr:hypothetical protein [Candidatus Aminicenantes bacterium]